MPTFEADIIAIMKKADGIQAEMLRLVDEDALCLSLCPRRTDP
jgi:hypothetical protein